MTFTQLWGPPEPNSVVGNTEGEMVAFCTKPGRVSHEELEHCGDADADLYFYRVHA